MSSRPRSHTSILASAACVVAAIFAVGCGPAPGYEPEPQVPVGYSPVTSEPEPMSSAELAAQAEAGASAGATIEPAPGDIPIGANADEYADTDPSALTQWRPVLEGHGEWVDDSTYGTVWVPAESEVGADFQPYVTAGYWTYDDDWVWVSSYDWGWVPFHYGRWVYLPVRGWAWIPGRTYSGAWVVWRTGGPTYGYVGWAPAPPSWYWYGGVAYGWGFGWYHTRYVYCSRNDIYSPVVSTVIVRGPRVHTIEARTRPYVAAAPSVGGKGRVLASPGVGGKGRVLASPSVGASGHRVTAHPRVGPKLAEIGVSRARAVRPPAHKAGLERAKAFATPRTAVARGASPPGAVRLTRPHRPDHVITSPASRSVAARRTGNPYLSRLEPAARAPRIAGTDRVPAHRAAPTPVRPGPRRLSIPQRVSPSARVTVPRERTARAVPRPQPTPHRATPSRSSLVPRLSAQPVRPHVSSRAIRPHVSSRAVRPHVSTPSRSFRASPRISTPSRSFRASPRISAPSRSFHSSPHVSRSFRASPRRHVSSPSRSFHRSSRPRISAPRVGHSVRTFRRR